ncbi:MAG: thioredoxin domain-containing protein [Nonomuraea sp.]|nr:thioredoxin domain-containing protein [Nonomuraea sp.]
MGKGDREKSAREKIKAQQAADRARDQRKKVTTYITVGVVAVAAVALGWWYTASQSASEEASGLAPTTVQADGSVAMAKAGVTGPTLDIYEDFQCPVCKQLEEISGSTFRNLANEGKAKVVYHPITIFGDDPLKSNSVRAASAIRCVTDGKQWLSYHDILYKNQPAEGSVGFELPDLVSWGKDAGVTAPGFDTCVTQQQKAAAQTAFSDKILKEQNIQGTPTVKLNGQDMDLEVVSKPAQLREAVAKASK